MTSQLAPPTTIVVHVPKAAGTTVMALLRQEYGRSAVWPRFGLRGWAGPCVDQGSCVITLTASTIVAATFFEFT